VQVGELLANSGVLSALLASRINNGDQELDAVRSYIETTQSALQQEHATLTRVLTAVSEEITKLSTILDDFRGDLEGLELICSPEYRLNHPADSDLLAAVFGAKGTSVSARLASFTNNGSDVFDAVLESIESLGRRQSQSRGDTKQMLAHAINRLEQLADHLELEMQEFSK